MITIIILVRRQSSLLLSLLSSHHSIAVHRAKQFREAMAKKHDQDCGLAMIVKQRAAANEIERMDLVGSVQGCDAIIGTYLPLLLLLLLLPLLTFIDDRAWHGSLCYVLQ